MFRRPKKPIRPRVITTESTGDEEDDENGSSPKPMQATRTEKKPVIQFDEDDEPDLFKKSAKSKLLSFDDDLKEDEDGEVFRVKKSSVSRRLMKQRDREKKESKKFAGNALNGTESNFQGSAKSKKDFERDVQIKIEAKPIKKEEDFVRILSGREAEAVDMESGSEDEDEGSSNRMRFSSRTARQSNRDVLSDKLRRTLEQSQIPDANLVHEVRKRRQMARTSGAPAFIPVNDSERQRNQKSRLVRDDDENENSEDDDEDRMNFSVIGNSANIDRERRKEAFEAAQEQEIEKSDDDSETEMDEWESQQLRKGVSKNQMNSVAMEVRQQKELMGRDNGDSQIKYINQPYGQDIKLASSEPIKKTMDISAENIVNGMYKLDPGIVLSKLTNRLSDLNLSRENTTREISGLNADLELVKLEIMETKTAVPMLSSRFTLYQKLRGYVTDLVDCLRCKIPILKSLEHRMAQLLKIRNEHLVERRRQDVRDQLEEINMMLNAATGMQPVIGDAKSRRSAEREGRRTRRRRLRELKGLFMHKDGLSSDDEETELEITTFKNQRDLIIKDSQLVFEDVNAEFASLDEILSSFREWRQVDLASYQECYANLCIPKLVSSFIRLNLLKVNPLEEDSELMDSDWMKSLVMYGTVENETFQTLTLDPDSRTAPLVIEKVLLPWIDSVVKVSWDPISVRQTRRLVNLITKLINEWSLGPNSKSMHSIMCTVISKFKDAVDNDVFIPIFPKSAISNKCTPASVFSTRQFWISVKLVDNISSWTGILSDKPLQILALDALLTRYILLSIRTAVDLADSVEKAAGVVNVLPRSWLSKDANEEVPNGIQQLVRCLVFVVQSSDCTSASNRAAIPEIAKILKSIGAASESQAILSKYA